MLARVVRGTLRLIIVTVVLSCACALPTHPDCTALERWPTVMATGYLRNHGLATSESLRLAETNVIRLASEQIGRDLYRQVHEITFTPLSGPAVQVIAVSDASSLECSMSDVVVYVVQKPPE